AALRRRHRRARRGRAHDEQHHRLRGRRRPRRHARRGPLRRGRRRRRRAILPAGMSFANTEQAEFWAQMAPTWLELEERLDEVAFDAAYSRFGVMFFGDPVAAFTNLRRALRPGGRLAFVCWQNVFANEWMLVPGAAAASVTGSLPQMPEPDAPGPFSLAEPDRVRSILGAAGF